VLHQVEHYLHGELASDKAAVLAEHLSECGHCLDRAEFQRKLKDIVRSKCRSDTPTHLVERIRFALRTERLGD
jgi:mycothiol system anti-sigma-R factor